MLKHLFNGILSAIALPLLDRYRQLSVQLLKIEAARAYVHGVRMARRSAIGLMGLGLLIALIGLGALLLHAGLFVLLPWSMEAKAVLGVVLGLAYMVLGGIALHAAMAEKTWLAKSGASAMLDEATQRDSGTPR